MNWGIVYLPEAQEDLRKLDGSQIKIVQNAITKARQNPLPKNEGGYGIPLGNKGSNNLTGFLEIKLRKPGIRIVYTLVRNDKSMVIVIVGMRKDDEVYDMALNRIKKKK